MPKSKKRAMSARKATKKTLTQKQADKESFKALLKLKLRSPGKPSTNEAKDPAVERLRAQARAMRTSSYCGCDPILRSHPHGIRLGE